MKEKQRRFGKGQKIKRWPILLIGIVLLLATVFVHGSVELNRTKEMAENTVDMLRQQCQSFNRLLVSDRTKKFIPSFGYIVGCEPPFGLESKSCHKVLFKGMRIRFTAKRHRLIR